MAVTKKQAAAKPAKPTKPTKPDELAPATGFAASGAVIEEEIVERVDMSHPSVDANPRANSTGDMNRIDFNNPSGLVNQEESVIENLEEAGLKPKKQD